MKKPERVSPVEIVLLLVGILAAQLLFWIPFILWMRGKSARLVESLRDEVAAAGEAMVEGPSPGIYRGGSGRFSRVRGNGIVALTDRRLIFAKLIGQRVEVPLNEISEIREDRWFLGSARGGSLHLILKTSEGEVGFMMRDQSAYRASMERHIAA